MPSLSRERYSRQTRNDLLLMAACSVFVFLLAYRYDLGDMLLIWLAANEAYELDELFLLLDVFGIMFAVFAYRRWRELQAELNYRAELEAELRRLATESRGILRAFFEHSPSPVFARDMQGRYVLTNQSYENWHNNDRAALLGKTPIEVLPLTVAEEIMQRDQQIIATEMPISNEEEVQLHGSTLIYLVDRFPIYSDSGELIGVGGIATDITALRAVEVALRASEARFQLVINSSKISVSTHDTALRYTWISNAIGQITADATIGLTDSDLFGEQIGGSLQQFKTQVLQNGMGHSTEIEIVVADEAHIYEWRAEPIRQDDGTIIGLHCAAIDRTIQRALERQLEHARALEMIGRVAGGVAHDFNNLLTVIQGGLTLFRDEYHTSPQILEELLVVEQATQLAIGLTRRLLTFARKQTYHHQLIHFNEWLVSQQRLLAHLVGSEIQLRLTVSSVPCFVSIDPIQFAQVLLNLTMNAREAMPYGGTLTMSLEHELEQAPNQCRLVVEDTGSGMDSLALTRIFEPFYSTKPRGSGLGLAVCHSIIQEHKGTITVTSIRGQGTTFSVTLPLATELHPSAELV